MDKLNSLLIEYANADYDRQNQIYNEICIKENIDELINSFSTEDQNIIQSAQQILLDLDIPALKRLMIYFASTKNIYIENYTSNTIKFFEVEEIIEALIDLKSENFQKKELVKLIYFIMVFLDLKELNDEKLEKLEKLNSLFKTFHFIQKLEIDKKEINNNDLIRLKSIFAELFASNIQENLQYINELKISDNNIILLTKYFCPCFIIEMSLFNNIAQIFYTQYQMKKLKSYLFQNIVRIKLEDLIHNYINKIYII